MFATRYQRVPGSIQDVIPGLRSRKAAIRHNNRVPAARRARESKRARRQAKKALPYSGAKVATGLLTFGLSLPITGIKKRR